MANLKSIAEQAYLQCFPNRNDETDISLEEFIETAKNEYAYQFLLWYWKEKNTEGFFNIPGNLSSEEEFEVIDNEIDITHLEIMSRLPNDLWLQNIGGLTCDCKYVKSNINQTQLLQDDDSMGGLIKPYLIVGRKIKFPQGTHKNKLLIIYANSGRGLNDWIEVDDAIGSLVRNRLIEIFLGKIMPEDKTNTSSSNV